MLFGERDNISMNIMVFDVPAISGGALSILNDFHNKALNFNDKSVKWIFVVSKPKLKETKNIKVLRFPWIKKSWGHRLYFDHVIAPKLVKQYKIDKILSLQNVIIPHTSCNQILYLHQSLPFVDYKFSIHENKVLWVYQNVIGRTILNSVKKAQYVIVQTNWMKKACMDKTKIESKKIEVVPPNVTVKPKKYFIANKKNLSTFFYPANGASYKNHNIIVEACLRLKRLNIIDFEIIFTLNGDENAHIKDLYNKIQNERLPISFVGLKTREEVFEMYTKSILLFPSYIETFGLPMLEARLHKGIIFASDSPFSREILRNYKNAYFFNPFDSENLATLLKDVVTNKIKYKNVEDYCELNNFSILEKIIN